MIIKGEKREKKERGKKIKVKKKWKSGACDGSFSGWGKGGGGGREGQGEREGGGQKWGRRLPPPHPSRAGTRWKRSHTAPAASAPQAFIRPPRHHVAPAAAPTGHGEGLPGPARSPGSVSPARDAFEERRCPLPWLSDAPGFVRSRLLQEGGDRRWIKPLPAPSAPRCWRLSDPIPARCDGRLPRRGLPRRVPSSPKGCPSPKLGGELQTSHSLADGDPHSARTEPPAPLRGRVNLGIPAPLLHALTSPTRHRGRSTLPGNPPPPRAPTEGMLRPAGAARRARSNSLPSRASREK